MVENSSTSEDDTVSPRETRGKNGKLISGKLVKVDDLDIKVQVHYPHAKLNGEFMAVKDFDKLPLNLFAAGEIELILRTKYERESQV